VVSEEISRKKWIYINKNMCLSKHIGGKNTVETFSKLFEVTQGPELYRKLRTG
jgi:hypothetical protein